MRYAVRLLLRDPGFTALAVLSIALGIAGNTLMFSIVDAVLIRSLPYPESDRLVFVWFTPPNHPEQKRAATAANFLALRVQNRALEDIGTVGGVDDTATFEAGPGCFAEQVGGQRFSAAIPKALGAKALMGRWFTDEEDVAEAGRVVMISYRLWQRRFGGAVDILGKTVRIDGEPTTIVGVTPEGWMLFNYPAQFWAPVRLSSSARDNPSRTFPVAARLKPGLTLRQAQEEMNAVAAALGGAFPSTNKGWGIRLEPALDLYVGWVRKPLLIVQGVVFLVLLISCANVTGLLLAQAATRKREVAVRAALGAGRWRIARQFLIESTVLSLLGGVLGIVLAWCGLKLFVAISPAWFPRVREIALDAPMLGFTALISLATGLVFGVIPALGSSRPDLAGALKAAGRGITTGIDGQRLRGVLVVIEVSLALVLLIGTGLMLNTFLRLYNSPTGCDCRNLLSFQVDVKHGPRAIAVFEKIRERISGITGVQFVAAGVRPPFGDSTLGDLKFKFTIEGRATAASGIWFPVSAGYFHTLGVPILRGREFGVEDRATAPPVLVINEALARRYWPNQDPVGKRLRVDKADEPSREIVGVVGDLRHNRFDREAPPQMYVPYLQHPQPAMTFVVRSAGDQHQLVPALRGAVAEVDRNLPIFNIRTVDEYLADQLWQPRQTMILLSIFSGTAVVLAMAGVYGIIANAVRQRTYEIGIRMALGASRRDVLRLVIAQGMLLVSLGVAIGVGGAFAFTRLLQTLLWGVTPTDPLTYAVVVVTLVAVSVPACYLPARCALEIEPVSALRYE
jgi:putative ABC transport system permease protein